ncbi:MAG: hypothetical protein ACXWT4_18290 [Methylobacter sp.]
MDESFAQHVRRSSGFINGTGNALNNILIGNVANNTLKGGAGADTFVLGTGGVDVVLDFLSGKDHLRFKDGAEAPKIGDGDHVIDNATVANVPGAFSKLAELVIFTSNITAAINATSAANTIGSASAAYATGDIRLFAVDNGVNSAFYQFKSANGDALVSAPELTLVGTLQGTAQTVLADYAFA